MNDRKCRLFSDHISNCKLLDLGAEGPRFTWRGPVMGFANRMFKRLDRGLCNTQWRNEFHEAYIKVGSRLKSDHHPIIIDVECKGATTSKRPFRFEAAWLKHTNFRQFLRENWNHDQLLHLELQHLEPKLMNWNATVFGHIRQRKNRLIRRISGIEKASQEGSNRFLDDLLISLNAELNEVLNQEEILWFQKSRAKWLADGDRNTSYYHSKTTVRRRRNRVHTLKNEDGEWIEGDKEVGQLVNSMFTKLFSEEKNDRSWIHTEHTWPEIEQDVWSRANAPVSHDEIKEAMYSIGGLKAPGIDGFPAIFYQKNWDQVGNGVCKAIVNMWNNPREIKTVNNTLITLIPKVDSPDRASQFRPISLCNVLYKCLPKILVKRLKEIISKVISPFQASFVPGRSIHDNIIVVNEMIHSMRRKKGKTGFMAIKVDLEKAYDRISWTYMEKVLTDLSCPGELITRIMKCVHSNATSILWNGEKLDEFHTSRGLRQGDPISPYLFVLGMEKLTHMILDRVKHKHWCGLKAGRNGPMISHMMFADDLVLFAEANSNQLNEILTCLQEFMEMSGHKLSQEKTYIYFSPNVKHATKRAICVSSGFKEVQDLGRYLGANISHPKRRKAKYETVIERIKTRLSGWNTASLSMAGRITLVKSFTSSMALYPMQHDRLPSGVTSDIEKAQRSFIWGEQEGSKKRHAINWNQLCKPKDVGGLGIRNLQLMNDAFLSKILWRMHVEPTSLWAQVLLGKYGRSSNIEHGLISKHRDSKLWKELAKLWVSFHTHIQYEGLEDGSNSPVWKPSSSGNFTVASFYKMFQCVQDHPRQNIWRLIWNLHVPERIRNFTWLATHGRLTTNDIVCKWENSSGLCKICMQERECGG